MIFAATTIVAIAVASSSIAAGTDSQSTTVAVSGTVPNVCVLTTPTISTIMGNVTAPTLAGNSGGSDVIFPELVNATTAKLNSTGFNLKYADSYCNYAHTFSIKAQNGGLVDQVQGNANPISTSGAFIRRIGYSSYVRWAGPSFTNGILTSHSTTTDAGDAAQTSEVKFPVTGANRADLELNLLVTPSSANEPVVQGYYWESFTLKLGPTL